MRKRATRGMWERRACMVEYWNSVVVVDDYLQTSSSDQCTIITRLVFEQLQEKSDFFFQLKARNKCLRK